MMLSESGRWALGIHIWVIAVAQATAVRERDATPKASKTHPIPSSLVPHFTIENPSERSSKSSVGTTTTTLVETLAQMSTKAPEAPTGPELNPTGTMKSGATDLSTMSTSKPWPDVVITPTTTSSGASRDPSSLLTTMSVISQDSMSTMLSGTSLDTVSPSTTSVLASTASYSTLSTSAGVATQQGSQGSTRLAPILGGVLGGVIALLLGFAFFFLRRKRRRRRIWYTDEDASSTASITPQVWMPGHFVKSVSQLKAMGSPRQYEAVAVRDGG